MYFYEHGGKTERNEGFWGCESRPILEIDVLRCEIRRFAENKEFERFNKLEQVEIFGNNTEIIVNEWK